jgi:hypothetical protein
LPSLLKRVKRAVKKQAKTMEHNRKVAKAQKVKEEIAFEEARRKEAIKQARIRGRRKAREPSTLSKLSSGLGNLSSMGDFDPFPSLEAPGLTSKKKKKKNKIFNPLDY